jgi:glutathione S-transferase
MEPILIYGVPAGSSMGLVAALEWLGHPYALCRVDMLGEMREAAYARVNARHETPVLITDTGQPLTETMAIAGWIEARDTQRQVSLDPLSPASDRMHQMMAYVNTGFTGAFSALWTAMEMAPPEPAYQAALQRFGRAAVIERHDKLEALIGDSLFAIGDHPTLADAVLVGVARWLDIHEVASASRCRRGQRLRERIEGTPAVQFALAVERGEAPTGCGACRGHVALADVISRYGSAAPQ